MICVSVSYPSGPGARFDHAYYQQKHRALVMERLGGIGLTRIEMDQGLSGMTPGSEPMFTGAARLYFNTMGEFQQAMALHGAELMADIPNYTDIQPQFQVSETA
jgi:uncharacterized protein (TIGR02118 family)